MTAAASPTITQRLPTVRAGVALVGLALAVLMRVQVAGVAGARSPAAGVLFGLALLAVVAGCGLRRPSVSARQIGWGLGGAVVLCTPAVIARLARPGVLMPGSQLATWAAIVALVAVAEELVLRGVLYDAVCQRHGARAAIAVTTIAFALLHVPIYGWHVLLLDLAAGYLFGILRASTGSVTAPAIAHTIADLAGWWLR